MGAQPTYRSCCEFDRQIAEPIAENRANRDAAAYCESSVHTYCRVVLWK
jgi:hypothetical protein